jgi:hypothetical protein
LYHSWGAVSRGVIAGDLKKLIAPSLSPESLKNSTHAAIHILTSEWKLAFSGYYIREGEATNDEKRGIDAKRYQAIRLEEPRNNARSVVGFLSDPLLLLCDMIAIGLWESHCFVCFAPQFLRVEMIF